MFIRPQAYMIIAYVWYKLFYKIFFITNVFTNPDLFIHTFHAYICAYTWLENETHCQLIYAKCNYKW